MLSREFDVALSFCLQDREIAYELQDELRKRDLSVYYDERCALPAPGGGNGALLPSSLGLTARLVVALVSDAYLTACGCAGGQDAALPAALGTDADQVMTVRVGGAALPGDAAAVAGRIAERIDRNHPPATAAAGKVGGRRARHVLPQFAPAASHKSVDITRYGLVHLMAAYTRGEISLIRVRAALELRKYLIFEHDFALGWPYDMWRADGSVFLSTLPNFSLPQQTLEFAFNRAETAARLKGVWVSEDETYGKLDFHRWQPSVAMLTADRVVCCLEREVAIRLLEKGGAAFGFPVTSGEAEATRFCGWIEELPPYEHTEWGRDPRLVGGRLGPVDYVLHDAGGAAVLTLLLIGRWSAAAFRALGEALAVNLPGRHHVAVLGQGRVRVTVFLADTHRRDTGRAFLAVRRAFAAVARMYAALRELPVPPPNGSVALQPPATAARTAFEQACGDLGGREDLTVAEASRSGFEAAPLKRLGQTPEGRSLGFGQEPVLDLDPLVTHRDIVRFVQEHE